MADKRSRRLPPGTLKEDLDALAALDAIADYTPSNADFSKAKGETVKAAAEAAQTKEVQDAAKAKASRDAAVSAEWDRHEYVLGIGTQVKAQYGENSDEYASLGFKKKSEYQPPRRRPRTP